MTPHSVNRIVAAAESLASSAERLVGCVETVSTEAVIPAAKTLAGACAWVCIFIPHYLVHYRLMTLDEVAEMVASVRGSNEPQGPLN